MSRQGVRLSDSDLRKALTAVPRPGLSVEIGEEIAGLVRATPQRRLLRRWTIPFGPPTTPFVWARPLWLLVAIVLLLGAALAIAIASSRPPPPVPMSNGVIAFGSDRVGLMLVDPRSGAVQQFVPPWEAAKTGRTDRNDVIGWSPTGDRLAYLANHPAAWSIEALSVPSGASAGRIVGGRSRIFPEWGMQWLEDGVTLVLGATEDGSPTIAGANFASGEVYRIGPPGTLSFDPAVPRVGRRVAFMKTDDLFGTEYALVVTNDRGGNATEILRTLPDGAVVVGAPNWSPDGRELVVTVQDAGGRFAVARVNDRGDEAAIVSPWIGSWVSGSWSPDGSKILAVVSPQGGRAADIYTNDDQRAELFIVNRDGSGWRKVSDRACAGAVWAPDGRAIAFASRVCEQPREIVELRVLDVDGSNERILWSGDALATDRISIGWQGLP